MPIVTVTALPHDAERELLHDVADAVAAALGLSDGDVIAISVPAHAAVANGEAAHADDAPWMLIAVHGSDRGEEPMRRACAAAHRAAADWSRKHGGERGVWCEWLLPRW